MKTLEGVRVIDLTHALAGPFCTFQLCQLGADVVKVERPGDGDDFRVWLQDAFHAINAGKRSVTLDLKSGEGRDLFGLLVREADIVIENYRPGVAAALGVGWEDCHRVNPRLIYCSISGYGQSGPLSQRPAIEWAVQAASGLTMEYLDERTDPSQLGLPVVDAGTGYVAFSAILAALLQRQRSGGGQRIDVAMLDSALNLVGPVVTRKLKQDGSRRRMATSGRYRAQDRWMFVSIQHQKWFEAFCRVADAPELAGDPRFRDAQARAQHEDELRHELAARFSRRPAAYWEEELSKLGIPAAPVRDLTEVAMDPDVRARGQVQDVGVEGSTEAVATVVGAPFRFAHEGPEIPGPVPALGQHTEEVLLDLGLDASRIAELRARRVV